mgnify:FL=1
MRHIIIILLFLSATIITTAQEVTLNQCIQYALENNLAFANKNIEADIAKEQLSQQRREFLPSLNVGGSANKLFGRSIDPTTNSFVNQDFFSMNFYLDSDIQLFRSFTRVNTVKFLKLQYLISNENIKQHEMEIVFAVMNKYYDVLYFANLQKIVQEQVELTNLNLQKTEKLVQLGLKSDSDLMEMKAQEASELHNLILAQSQHEQALLALKSLMNYPYDEALSIEDKENIDVADTLFLPEEVYASSLEYMPSVQCANLYFEVAQKQLNIARGNLLPRLSMGAGVYSNYADSRQEYAIPGDINSELRAIPLRDQLSQNMAKSIYLSMSIPIFNRWSGMSRVKQAKLERTMAQNRQQEEQQKLYQLINEDIQQLNALQKEFALLSTKKDVMQQAYTIAEKKLEQGIVGVIEFYTAKNQLAQAQSDWMRTRIQLKIKEQTIRFYMGEKVY